MITMLKEASYFLSGFYSDKECQNENSSLTLHMRILCNFFILPGWNGYLNRRVDKEVPGSMGKAILAVSVYF
jgi:hypothetical protein